MNKIGNKRNCPLEVILRLSLYATETQQNLLSLEKVEYLISIDSYSANSKLIHPLFG